MPKNSKVVRRSRSLQFIILRPFGMIGCGDDVRVLYPGEKPEDRFDTKEVVRIVKIPVKGDHFDYRDVTRFIRALEEFSDGLPISDLLEHVAHEFFIKMELCKDR